MTDPFAAPRRRDTAHSLEIGRICALPTVELPTDEEVECVSRQLVQAEPFERGYRLHREQVGAILAVQLYGGLFAPIGVGRGKTFVTLLAAELAFRANEVHRSLLVVPTNVLAQLLQTDIPAARRLLGVRVPFLHLSGRTRAGRLQLASSGKRGCYVMPYSQLSVRDAEEVITAIAPGLVILDEAHRVKNRTAARTRRLLRLLERFQPRLAALSGTITSKSIRDYHHLISHALREGSPLPLEPGLVDSWAAVLDAGAGEDPGASATGPIAPLVDWARGQFPSAEIPRGLPGFRAAFRLRLNSAPGVVASGGDELGVSLVLRNAPVEEPGACEGHAELDALARRVEELWISPSGDEIEHGMHKWRHLYELASGFYYRLRWPEVAELAEKRRLTQDEATAYLAQAQAHHEALQEYHRLLRRWLERRGRPGLDTPLLVGSDMLRHGAANVRDEDLYKAWTAARELEFDGMPERLSEPIRICAWKVRQAAVMALGERAAARQAGEPDGVLVWYYHRDFGRWLVEVLDEADADPLWCPADSERPGASQALASPANQGRIVVVSMLGHGTGVNLQGDTHQGGSHHGFRRQVLAEFPRKADLLEQVLGRTHRHGQQADELSPVTLNTSEFDHQNMSACLIDSLYIHQSTGSRQKAIYASYDPLPRVYPPDFLRERGFSDVAKLDPAARAALEEKFGPLS